MVQNQIEARGIHTPEVLAAMRKVERHLFVKPQHLNLAYKDGPLPIDYDQTISQPYIVALMTDLLALTPTSKVLEIGTGCGYQTAILAELAKIVYSVEIIPALAKRAKTRLEALNNRNVHLKKGMDVMVGKNTPLMTQYSSQQHLRRYPHNSFSNLRWAAEW